MRLRKNTHSLDKEQDKRRFVKFSDQLYKNNNIRLLDLLLRGWIYTDKSCIFASDWIKRKRGNRQVPSFLWISGIVKKIESLVVEEKTRDLLEKKYEEADYQDCFTVEVNYNTANKKLQVFVDSDSGMTFRKCQRLSRYLESFIDEENWLGEKYTLEVSSPGVDRPLILPRQFKKNIGRRLEVDVKEEQKTQKGELIKASDEGIVLAFQKTRKQGKKKIKEDVELEIPYDQIEKAIVKISFKK